MTEKSEFKAQPIIEHVRELKKRLVYCLLAFFVTTGISYYLAEDIYAFLVQPLADVFPDLSNRRLIYTSLTEAFITYLKLAMFAGFFLSFPIIATQLYLFLAPGLYKQERRALVPYLIAAPTLFLSGAAFVYYLIFPAAWQFFLGFESNGANGGLPIQLEPKVSDYLSLSMHLMMAFGLSFQLPVVLILLVRSGMVEIDTLKKGRRYAIVLIVTVAAFITPPDIFSQIALSVPLYMLYEISILLCRNMDKKSEDTEE
ncbi:MAG: twin-arginine translocase subunit TatC [Pseudomonadota bacterium]